MEQRILELEKKVQDLETALSLIGSQIGQQLDNIIEEYKNGFKEVTLKLIDEAKGEKVSPAVSSDVGRYQLLVGNDPAALSNSVKELVGLGTCFTYKRKGIYAITDRLTGETLLTNAWQYPKKGE